ncbi:MAG: phosphatase PAP2 family protein [bacterium]|nr:phosphatase PAP2 family protein [bacterium]
MTIDLNIFQFLYGATGQYAILDWFFVFLASYLGPLLFIGAIVVIARNKQRFYFFSLTVLGLLLARGLMVEAIRFFYYRARPFVDLNIAPLISHDYTASFPSGHASFYFALALSIWYLNRRQGTWFLVAAGLIGLARIIIGVHWPSDIVMGAITGLVSVFIIQYLLPDKASFNRQPD